jgi:hypothetical protein
MALLSAVVALTISMDAVQYVFTGSSFLGFS